MLRAKVNVFLELHRRNRQLERMLTDEERRFDEIAERLTAIEEQPARGELAEVAELRHRMARLHDALRALGRARSTP
ncbi:hypothetical protein [Streptomyces sp. NPDC051994]|uniref:hypothetical protein n=1 Tax=unclassified Streptomyces TaxID=2593676 RepID=UPI0034330BDF